MRSQHSRRTVIIAALLAASAPVAACGNRENERGNPGAGPQSPGVKTGTNPAQAAQTTPKKSSSSKNNAPY